MKAKIVYENIEFERGKDPKSAMGIGAGPVNILLSKIDAQAKDFGFKRVEPKINTEEYGNIQLAKWIRLGDSLEIWAYRGGDREPVELRDRTISGIFASYKLSHWGSDDDKISPAEWAEEWPWENNFGFKKYTWVQENIEFNRGMEPKRALDVGHAKLYPAKTLFLEIYDYCKKNKFPGFERVSDIQWLDRKIDRSDPKFVAYVKEKPEINAYTVYLADNDKAVIAFHEHRQKDGDWRDVDYEITSIDHWRRLMESNHVRHFSVDEAQDFERGKDPKEAMRIGLPYLEVFGVARGYLEANDKNYCSPKKGKEILRKVNKPGLRNVWISYRVLSSDKVYQDSLDFVLTRDFMQDIYKPFNYLKYDGEYFPIDSLVESEFERGKDPREALKIGIEESIRNRLLPWSEDAHLIEWVYETDHKESNLLFQLKEHSQSNSWVLYVYSDGVTKGDLVQSDIPSYQSFEELKRYVENEIIKYLKYKLYTNESIEFERGKDPYKALNIGNKDVQLTKEIDAILSKVDLEEVPISIGPEAHLHDIAQWEGKINGNKITVVLSRNLDPTYKEKPYMSTVYVGDTSDINNISAELDIEDMMVPRYWDNAFDDKPLHEAQNFERGKDPKEVMGVGTVANALKVDALYRWGRDKNGVPVNKPVKTKFAEEILHYPYQGTRSTTTSVSYTKNDGEQGSIRLDNVLRSGDDLIYNGKLWKLRYITGTKMISGYDPYLLNESLEFERGSSPYDALDIGKHRSDVTLDMDKQMGYVATPQLQPLEDPYDIKKFFQNLEMGLYPSNLGIGFRTNGNMTYVYASDLKDWGFENIRYEGKNYKLG